MLARTLVVATAMVLGLGLFVDAARAADPPPLSRDLPFECRRDAEGRVWRLQCDDRTRTCRVAPDAVIDAGGGFGASLERARPCVASAALDLAALRKGGYTIERAIADAPEGWARDARGRVFQVTFDLRRRLWIGTAWAPRHEGDGGGELGRVALDVGGLELFVGEGGTRHHLQIVHGTIEPAPFRARLTALTYALHRRWDRPLVRITTFFGRPRRGDIDLNAGAWLELGGLEMRRRGETTDALARLIAGHVALDLWQAPDLSSWVRLRGGVGLERTVPELGEGESRVVPGAALELDTILDDAGLYRATATAGWDRALGAGPAIDRFSAEAAIEAVVLAINDQPISVRVSGLAAHRDDDEAEGWDLSALVGLRLSFWAPAR